MKFELQGKRSKAWWLQLIKANNTTGAMMRHGEVPTYTVQDATGALVLAGLVERHGKVGRGLKPTYQLSSMGHRYLNEHPDELEQPTQMIDAVRPGKVHAVAQDQSALDEPIKRIEAVDKSVQRGLEIANHVATNGGVPIDDTRRSVNDSQEPTEITQPGIEEHDFATCNNSKADCIRFMHLGSVDRPASVPDYTAAPSPGAVNTSVDTAKTDFISMLRTIAGDLALDKFASEITIKDLLEYVEVPSGGTE